MRYLLLLFICLLGFSSAVMAENCNKADAINHPNFCTSFKNAAMCHCGNSIKSRKFCEAMGMEWVWNRMMDTYHSLQSVCIDAKKRGHSEVQECIDSWKAYRGGRC